MNGHNNIFVDVSESMSTLMLAVLIRKKAGYPEIFGSDTGSGYPKIFNYPPTVVSTAHC